ncbi:hypothetical protein [Cylindrospermopsis raciborskii]|uniref:hypothetical protein n=1 Tax=Cylindrospermopsis raciborskii TaxID=77022 RepID=UPI0022BDA626|nr:hypothetical protein [Cylindrospermopsis raciborskii]MCZ2207878.1 hypothetical protein [Cylindrospermopsis raciborskii PAMP2011]
MSIVEKILVIYYKNLMFQLHGYTLDEYIRYCTEEEELDSDEVKGEIEYKTDKKRVLASSVYWLTTREWDFIEQIEKSAFPPDFQEYMDAASEREIPMPLDYEVSGEQLALLRELLQGSDEAAYYASVIIHNLASEIEARESGIDRSTHTGWDHW